MDNTYSLGGSEVKLDASEAIHEIAQNKTLIIEKLSANTPVKPEIIEGIQTVEDVFAHFKPKVEVEFEDSEGGTIKEDISFNNLGDFGLKGITNKSSFLKELTHESIQYRKMIKQLKSNKILKTALADPESKKALVSAIKGLIAELNQDDK
jgi:hypothetical protein